MSAARRSKSSRGASSKKPSDPDRRVPTGAGPVDRQQPWSTRGSRVERIDRVLVDELTAQVEVRGPESHHLRDVLRVKPGSLVEAFDGKGSIARGEVVAVDRERVSLALGAAEASSSEAATELTLAVALLKGDKLSDVVRPATELGVSDFVLFVSTNCEARELSAVRLTRLRRVAQEAARQSGRAVVPTVTGPYIFAEVPLTGTVLIGDPAAETNFSSFLSTPPADGVQSTLSQAEQPGQATIVTGPEGGFTDTEVEQLRARGAIGLRLGPRILRADTAPVAMAAALLLGTEG